MKAPIRILLLIASTFLAAHAGWVDIPNVCPAIHGRYVDYNSSRVDAGTFSSLSSLTKGRWSVHYSNSQWNNASDPDNTAEMYILSSVRALGFDNYIYAGTQIATRFDLSASSIADTSKIRVSFDIMRVQLISFDASVNPWQTVNVGLQSSGIGPQAAAGNTNFNFSLVSYRNGNTIYSDKGLNWHYTGDYYDIINISFELNGEDLYADDGGYALVVDGVYDGPGTLAKDSYVFRNVKVEKLVGNVVPEPSSCLLAMIGLAALARRRRRS